jgi:hypothetical protein
MEKEIQEAKTVNCLAKKLNSLYQLHSAWLQPAADKGEVSN